MDPYLSLSLSLIPNMRILCLLSSPPYLSIERPGDPLDLLEVNMLSALTRGLSRDESFPLVNLARLALHFLMEGHCWKMFSRRSFT